MKLLTIFVRYGDTDYCGAFKRLCEFYRKFDGVEYDAILVDTSLPTDLRVALGSNIVMIGGDNTRREFSGWNSALEHFGNTLDQYDLVNIVTSAFENEYNGFYPYLNLEMLEFAARNKTVVLAHVDAYPDAAKLFGRSFQTWGCSKFLLTSPKRIKNLKTFVATCDADEIFSENPSQPINDNAPISDNYRSYLIEWLTGQGLPHGQWHSVFELSAENMQRFRSKALSIIDEHSLSLRLRETGARIVDYTWLHSKNCKIDPTAIPNEVTQVQQRNQYLFNNPIITACMDMDNHPLESDFNWLYQSNVYSGGAFGLTSLSKALLNGNRSLRLGLDIHNEINRAALYLNVGMPLNDKQRRWLSEIDTTLEQDATLPITNGLHALLLARDDLRAAFDLNAKAGREGLIGWWILAGMHDPSLSGFMPADVYAETDTSIMQDAVLPITKGLHALALSRNDLRSVFDIKTQAGRTGLIGWWILTGMRDPALSGFMPGAVYAETASSLEQDAALPITRGLHALALSRPDLSTVFDINTQAGRAGLIGWWMLTGMRDPALSGFMPGAVYAEVASTIEQDAALPITRGLHALALSRPDLNTVFDVNTKAGREKLVSWWIRYGIQESASEVMPGAIYAETASSLEQDAALPITRGLHALALSRPDLSTVFDVNTKAGREGLVGWWMLTGMRDPALSGFMPGAVYAEVASTIEQDAALPITRGLHALALSRPDLSTVFDISTQAGRAGLIGWWMLTGMRDPALSGFMPGAVYAEVASTIEQDAALPITRGLHALALSRSDLSTVFDVNTKAGREGLVSWWILYGSQESDLSGFMPINIYAQIDETVAQGESVEITKGLHAIYLARHDLQSAFDINSSEGRVALTQWFTTYRSQEGYDRLFDCSTPSVETPTIRNSQEGSYLSGGVNIIGFGRGELGIGEDVRMASLALRDQAIDYCVPHLPLMFGARKTDFTLRNYEAANPLYNVNLIFLPHYETLRLAAIASNEILSHRYNIGCWQWELPKFPQGMELTLQLVDEIWSSTKFTADAMRTATDKPVFVMPMAVNLPILSRSFSRTEFNLPDSSFIFLCVLDGNSSVYRKNPLAAIKAFKQAFGETIQDVHLCIKAMNMTNSNDEWDELLAIARTDTRVSVISETFSREKVIGLHSACDCFVSLHRAEGFGRNIAEAMLLGKPVIVSNFSGNTDFTNEQTAFLVGGKTIPVREHEYSFSEGQYWWDADIHLASEMMRRCIEEPEERMRRANNGRIFISENYSPEAVGKRYIERLRDIPVHGSRRIFA